MNLDLPTRFYDRQYNFQKSANVSEQPSRIQLPGDKLLENPSKEPNRENKNSENQPYSIGMFSSMADEAMPISHRPPTKPVNEVQKM